jgi:transcriptional regulator with XRE-family HTH domain
MRARHPNRIAELREAKGMRQVELARAVHAAESQISKLERFELPMSQDWMYRIARGLEREPWELLPEWGMLTPAEHIDALWQHMALAEKERVIRKYLSAYQDTVCKHPRPDAAPDLVFAEPPDSEVVSGSTLMVVEVKGDNLSRITFYRPTVPNGKTSPS